MHVLDVIRFRSMLRSRHRRNIRWCRMIESAVQRRSMDIRQLRYFLGVVHAKSTTGAAESLHVAQPAIGMQLRKLEDELGVKLLVRHSRGVVPTGAGEQLRKHATEILESLGAACQHGWTWTSSRASVLQAFSDYASRDAGMRAYRDRETLPAAHAGRRSGPKIRGAFSQNRRGRFGANDRGTRMCGPRLFSFRVWPDAFGR